MVIARLFLFVGLFGVIELLEIVEEYYNYDGISFPCDEKFDGYSNNNIQELPLYTGFPVHVRCSDALHIDMAPECLINYDCIIYKDGEIIFNSTVKEMWDSMGIFEVADDSWNGSFVNISLVRNNITTSNHYVYKLKESTFNCLEDDSDDSSSSTIGEEKVLSCSFDGIFNYKPVPEFTLWWYKDCKRIERNDSRYQYRREPFSNHPFSNLLVNNVSLEDTPGKYSCVLQNSSIRGAMEGAKLVIKTQRLCVKRNHRMLNEPIIRVNSMIYHVESGSDLKLLATGHTGSSIQTLSQSIRWMKRRNNKDILLCFNTLNTKESRNCYSNLQEHEISCQPSKDASKASMEIDDSFTAIFWIRNASKSDAGRYTVELRTTKSSVITEFKILIIEKNGMPFGMLTGLATTAVFLLLAIIILAILHEYRTDIKYIIKKFYSQNLLTTNPMAFLIYSTDVCYTMGNAVSEVTNFFAGRRFYDPNNTTGATKSNPAGLLVHEHVADMMNQCLRLIVFLTPRLLQGNDDENFAVYQGMENNLRKDLPVIFICTEGVKRQIIRKQYDNIHAIRSFISNPKNVVIIWNERKLKKFRRALYVALPKVPYRSFHNQILDC